MQDETARVVGVVADGTQRTQEGVATVERTREAFEAIGGAVEDMAARVGEITLAVDQISSEAQRAENEVVEVAAVAEESSASAEQVSASTQQTSASAQEIAASAQTLSGTAEHLNSLVAPVQGRRIAPQAGEARASGALLIGPPAHRARKGPPPAGPSRSVRYRRCMGFLDKAKKLAEQAQTKLDEVQSQVNKQGSPQQPSGPVIEYDKHGRPIPQQQSSAPPHGDPLANTPPARRRRRPAPTPDPARARRTGAR